LLAKKTLNWRTFYGTRAGGVKERRMETGLFNLAGATLASWRPPG
jgi:hypothetical protein